MTPSSIVIVGAGPRGAGLLERIAANAPELYGPALAGRGLDVHLIDPYPAGAGRIWRAEQSPLLAMNSMAADVTLFTDETVQCEGPIRPGPSFWEWTRDHADPDAMEPALGAELRAVTATTFPSRRLQSVYLEWVFGELVARLPDGMRVHVHRTRATGLSEERGRQLVHLDGAPPLPADTVVLASGHLDAAMPPDELALAGRAAEQGLRYLPPEQTTDTDLSVIAPGETVLVRGMGLAFIDLVVLLFEGRGGRFENDGDELRYVPSGAEPVLVAGSPRGAPYHSKTHYGLRAGRPPLPRFLPRAAVDAIVAAHAPVDLREQVWPLMAKEIAWGWYHELFLGHPDRVALPWAGFAERFAEHEWGSPAMAELITAGVPDPVDRINFAALDRPLDGVTAPDLAALQPLVRERIAEDLRQHVDPAHTPHLGAFVAMLSMYAEISRLAGTGVLSARSRAVDLRWWNGFFNGVASGPPGFRVRQLLALSRAGFVRFLGAGMWVDVVDGRFVAGSASLPGAEPLTADVLVDARLPEPSVARTTDPLLASLLCEGAISEDVLVDTDGTLLGSTGLIRVRHADGALVDATGAVHPRRFAVGPHTAVKPGGAFTRPGMNAQSLRYNDAVARAVLRSLPASAAAAA